MGLPCSPDKISGISRDMPSSRNDCARVKSPTGNEPLQPGGYREKETQQGTTGRKRQGWTGGGEDRGEEGARATGESTRACGRAGHIEQDGQTYR